MAVAATTVMAVMAVMAVSLRSELASPSRLSTPMIMTKMMTTTAPKAAMGMGAAQSNSNLQQLRRRRRQQLPSSPERARHKPWVVRQSTVDKLKDMVGRVPVSFETMVPDIVMKGADRVQGFYAGLDDVDGLIENLDDISHMRSNGVKALKFIEDDLNFVGRRISGIFNQDHPILKSVTEYFFKAGGKRIRPTMVRIMARAVLAHTLAQREKLPKDERLDTEGVLQPTQVQLAQITELIHTASLFHDDIIDLSDTRRGQKTINSAYGNRVAVLSGDFLLARSAVLLAELEDPRVITGMATSIEHLCGGELLQIKSTKNDLATFAYYIEKTFYKTGSLMAYACQSAAQLAGADDEMVEAAYLYGGYLGIAFQIVDDLLDIQQDAKTTGKPVGADMQNGHATAPVLYAMEEYPELKELILRRFKKDGDAERGLEMVLNSRGVEKTQKLIEYYQKKAIEAASKLSSSDARDALVNLAELVVARKS